MNIWDLDIKFFDKIMVELWKTWTLVLTVLKWVMLNWPKILQMPQNLSAQIVCRSLKVRDFDEKRIHWASIIHGSYTSLEYSKNSSQNVTLVFT